MSSKSFEAIVAARFLHIHIGCGWWTLAASDTCLSIMTHNDFVCDFEGNFLTFSEIRSLARITSPWLGQQTALEENACEKTLVDRGVVPTLVGYSG